MTKLASFGFALLLSLTVFGCKDLPTTCGVPGDKQTCDCDDGRTGGTQTCRDSKWTACKCEGPIPVADASADGTVAGTGGTGATDAGGTGGTGGTGATDAGGTGGTGGTGAIDASVEVDAAVDSGANFPAAYTGPCADDNDCGPDAICLKNALATDTHCAPTCDMVADCPAAGSGTAVVECTMAAGTTEKACRFQCFGAVCPTDLTCEGILPGASFCF